MADSELPEWMKTNSTEENLLGDINLDANRVAPEDEFETLRRNSEVLKVSHRIFGGNWEGASEALKKLGIIVTADELQTLGANNEELMEIYINKGPEGYLAELRRRFPNQGSLAA